MQKPIEERIRDSHYWRKGEPFTANDMAQDISAKRNSVVTALRRMGDDVEHLNLRNGAPLYGRKNKLAGMIHRKMVSGKLSYTGCGPLEWQKRGSNHV